jgi:hypothetical protein
VGGLGSNAWNLQHGVYPARLLGCVFCFARLGSVITLSTQRILPLSAAVLLWHEISDNVD